MRDLKELREEIDRIDESIKSLYRERLDIAKEVATYKIANNKPVYDADRERDKIKRLTSDLEDNDVRIGVEGLFNRLMADSRRVQYEIITDNKPNLFGFNKIDKISGKDFRIIYQGEPGAYSQAALLEFFGNQGTVTNVSTWREAMEEVKAGLSDYCVLPIENSTAGSVTEIYDLLPEYELTIVGEQVIPISHTLLGVPGTELSDIKEVYSHPQALMQCEGFFTENKDIVPVKTLNTALAAKAVSEQKDKSKAAIAGLINAKLYGLSVIKEDIQDEHNNKTRFIILKKGREFLESANKISVSFLLKHEKGTLYHALSYLSDNDVNLSLIESRPIRHKNWEYRFFVDMEGNLLNKQVQRALSGLIEITRDFRILGNY